METNKQVAERFMRLVDEIESTNEADYALKHLTLFNRFMVNNPHIVASNLIQGLEELQNGQ